MSPRSTTLRSAAAALVLWAILAMSADAAARPAWWSYDRPATLVSVHRQIQVPMRDGVKLGCDLHLPARGGRPISEPTPSIIYEVTPYAISNPIYLEQGRYFASRGYSAVTCNVRGTGRSGGGYPQMNQPAEQSDAYDLVEWVASQSWSNGRVGQTGESYGGMMTYRAAASRAPHLVAVAPQQAPNDLYLNDVYPGGVRAAPLSQNWWPLIAELTTLGRVRASRLFAVQRRHPTRDAFWQQIAIDSVLDRIDVPVLTFAGWSDPLFRDGAVRNYERLVERRGPGQTFLVDGPWTHGFVFNWPSCRAGLPGCTASERVPPGALLAWFDRLLAGRDDAPLPTAAVTSYQGPRGVGAGWRERATVFPDATTQTLTLDAHGNLASAADAGPAGTRAWTADPLDGLLRRTQRLSFTSAPFPNATDLAGRPTAHLTISSTQRDANVHAELLWIRPNGSAKAISDAWLKASHRSSHEFPQPITPGTPVTLTLRLKPLDLRLPAGSRLQLRLGSGSATQATPLGRRTTLRVATGAGGSSIDLPVAAQ